MIRRKQGRPTGRPSPAGDRLSGSRGGGEGAAAAAAPEIDGMRGPKAMALAILALIGGSLLTVHLRYLPDAPRPAGAAAPPALAMLAAPTVAVAPALPSPAPAAPAGPEATGWGGEDLPAAAPSLGVVHPVPMPASIERDRRVNECIERVVRQGGGGEIKPTAPGRWPALKRARDDLRMRRLAARSTCEQEVGGRDG